MRTGETPQVPEAKPEPANVRRLDEAYSFHYDFPENDDGTEYAVDWNYYFAKKWNRSDREYGLGHQWYRHELDERAYTALLEHFGLSAWPDEFPLDKIQSLSPRELATARRQKEQALGLPRIEINSDRAGPAEEHKD